MVAGPFAAVKAHCPFVAGDHRNGGAPVIRGNLAPECATAVRAVLGALGKKQGPEDDCTEGKRSHDALQLACELQGASCGYHRSRRVPIAGLGSWLVPGSHGIDPGMDALDDGGVSG